MLPGFLPHPVRFRALILRDRSNSHGSSLHMHGATSLSWEAQGLPQAGEIRRLAPELSAGRARADNRGQ